MTKLKNLFYAYPPSEFLRQQFAALVTVPQPSHVSGVIVIVEIHPTSHAHHGHQLRLLTGFLSIDQQTRTRLRYSRETLKFHRFNKPPLVKPIH